MFPRLSQSLDLLIFSTFSHITDHVLVMRVVQLGPT